MFLRISLCEQDQRRISHFHLPNSFPSLLLGFLFLPNDKNNKLVHSKYKKKKQNMKATHLESGRVDQRVEVEKIGHFTFVT